MSTNTCDVEQAVLKSAWEEFQEGIKFRSRLCGGIDPFSSQVSKAGKKPKQVAIEEEKERSKLGCLIKSQCTKQIQEVREELKRIDQKSKELQELYIRSEITKDNEEIHKIQFKTLKKIIKDLRLPYRNQIESIKKRKGETWRMKHTRLVISFTPRLRRALPICLKYDVDRNFIPNEEEIMKLINDQKYKLGEDLDITCSDDALF